jgi:predicted dehydrogenase
MAGGQMTNEDIIRMAHESGMYRILDQHASEYVGGMFEDTPYPELERFARLVAEAAAKSEREECAKVCDGWPDYDVQGLAEAIRARGKK